MSKLIDDAVRVLREFPDDVQAAAARAIIEYGAGHDDDQLTGGRRWKGAWPCRSQVHATERYTMLPAVVVRRGAPAKWQLVRGARGRAGASEPNAFRQRGEPGLQLRQGDGILKTWAFTE